MANCKECFHYQACKGTYYEVKEYGEFDGEMYAECGCDDFLPTVDVVEVKHGYWIKTERGIRISVNTGEPIRVYACDCSCCGWHTGHQGIKFEFCPHCGAEMDGGTTNEN